MTTLDGQQLFASGPCRLTAGPWRRATQRRGLAGLDGEYLLDLGRRGREIVQAGRLQAATAAEVLAAVAQIEAVDDGGEHTLTDTHGRVFTRVVIESFEPDTPQSGRGWWCDYTLRYRQLP